MNVSELAFLTQWVIKEIIDVQIPEKYQSLLSILQSHAYQNQPKQPFETEKNNLIETIKNVHLEILTKDQLSFLNKLGIANAVGSIGVENIEDILYKNVIDVATSAQKLQEIIQKLNEGIFKSNQIITGLDGCFIQEKYESDNEILMRICFTGDALMANVADFKEWGRIWFDIGRGIAMVNNLPPEEIKIVGATKGSLIIEMAIAYSIAKTASKIILEALNVADKALDIRKKTEELRGMKLINDKLLRDLETEAENQKKAGVDTITKEIIIQLQLKTNGEGEKINALEKSVKNLVNFIEKGGQVDFIIPDDNHEQENGLSKKNGELSIAFQQIRQLEKKIALLEQKKI